jgi:hypothetical protein
MIKVASGKRAIPRKCPHCRRGFVAWDERDRESYCFNCGWRNSIRVTAVEGELRKKWSIQNGAIVPSILVSAADPEVFDALAAWFTKSDNTRDIYHPTEST